MTITFVDLFAGIGGFHLSLSNLGAECVFASEKDKFAIQTYEENFGKGSIQNKDITKLDIDKMPNFDILCAGFPCQPFSIAGLHKGFDDDRGNMFFTLYNIIKNKQPKAYFLENVKNLKTHDKGNTYKVITDHLINKLEYSMNTFTVKTSDYGLPQMRQRIFMIGFRKDIEDTFKEPNKVPLKFTMSDVFEGNCTKDIGYTIRVGGRKSGVNDRRNWDGYLVDGEERFLGVKECSMMQGFPNTFKFPVSDTQALKQLGNAVSIDPVEYFGAELLNVLTYNTTKDGR